MRDHLTEFASCIADIQQVREIARTTEPDGVVRIVNEWRASQQIPAAIRTMLKIDDISWIDRNSWDPATDTCSWSVEPKFLSGHIVCSGNTAFAEAMGGRGTRVTFAGAGCTWRAGQHGVDRGGLCRVDRYPDHTAQSSGGGRSGSRVRTEAVMRLSEQRAVVKPETRIGER
jgi:hypothetical protein